ncbi:hypothetical protein LCGC14_3100990, partial [marine sediment metagenome]
MLFDKLCGMVERHALGIEPIIREAKLFEIDGRPQDFLSKELTWDLEQFFLPFRCVVIEDAAGVVLLYDKHKNQVGNDATRLFITVSSSVTPPDKFHWTRDSKLARDIANYRLQREETISITIGTIDNWKKVSGTTNEFSAEGAVFRHFSCTKREVGVDIDLRNPPESYGLTPSVYEALREESLRNTMVGIQEIYYLNQPSNFV